MIGGLAYFEAGPFLDIAGVALDLSAHTITLHLEPACGAAKVQAGSPVGTASGYLQYSTQAADLDELGQWQARFEATLGGGASLFSEPFRWLVVPVLP